MDATNEASATHAACSMLARGLAGACCVALLATAAWAQPQAAFSDQTAAAGLTVSHQPLGLHSYLGGGTVGDFNNDGWQDVYYPTGGGSPDRLFVNNGDGTFTDRAAEWGMDVTHRGTAACAGDYNDDGWLDIFVTSFGLSSDAESPGKHMLWRNNGDGTMTNVAGAAGVDFSSPASVDGWGGSFGDYDLDGDLDLAVAGWQSASGNRLFRNDGDGTFTDVTMQAGLAGPLASMVGFATRFVDMNGDRYPELLWVGDFGTTVYFANNGDGTFSDATSSSGTSLDGTEMGHDVADFNEDGLFDWYVTTISTNNLYISNGDDTYVNQADTAGVDDTDWGWGTVAVDFNHDTLVDIVATTQSGSQYAFLNEGNNGSGVPLFSEVSDQIGLISFVSGRGLANLDYDNDGDQDVIIFPNQGPLKLFRNDLSGTGTHWLRILLDPEDVEDIPPHGVGAEVRVTLGERTLLKFLDAGSNYLSQSELSVHYGLGEAAVVDAVRVDWPNGMVSTLENVAVDQTIVITPPAGPGLPGDSDGDGDVDLFDFADYVACTDDGAGDGCDTFDLDEDGDIDFADLAILQHVFTG